MEEETNSESSKSANSLPLIIGIIVIIIILLGAAFAFGNKNSKKPSVTSSNITNMQNETMTPPTSTSAAVSPSVSSESSKVKTFTVVGSNFKFAPNTMTVNEGDTVKIKFKSGNGFHDFVLDEFNVKTNVIGTGKEEDVSFVANKKGTFQYYCSVGNHRAMGMIGTLTVL
jgi:nitrite reductase (NO-forming)